MIPFRVMRPYGGTLLLSAALAAAVACGGGSDELPESASETEAPAQSAEPSTVQAAPGQPSESSELQVALATSDLSVGLNRFVFGVIDRESGPLRGSEVQIETYYLTPEGADGPRETRSAVWRKWPVGPGGVYTVELTFDAPGDFGVGLAIADPDGTVRGASTRVQVKDVSAAPAIGATVPRSVNKTSSDVAALDELTTDPDPDPDLYTLTIAEAVDDPRPLVVVFATPAYCQTATCGPQVDVVKGLKTRNEGKVNFIHIEVYDNPLEIQGDLGRGRISPTFTEWNLPSEPWTFIVDEDGVVRAKFEGFATSQELEEALAAVLP